MDDELKVRVDTIVGNFHFRSLTADDKEIYMLAQAEEEVVADFYQKYPDALIANMSRALNNPDEHSIVAFQRPCDQLIAICSFQGLQKDTIETGYTVVKELQGKGIGTRMAREFVQLAHNCFPVREIYARVRVENIASRRVLEKVGAEFVSLADAPEVEIIQRFIDENVEMSSRADALAAIERGKNAVRVYRV